MWAKGGAEQGVSSRIIWGSDPLGDTIESVRKLSGTPTYPRLLRGASFKIVQGFENMLLAKIRNLKFQFVWEIILLPVNFT